MNNAIIRVSAQRGLDPREFALVVFGGNGAVHAMHQSLPTYARGEEDVLISALRVRSAGVLKSPALQRFPGTSKPPKPKARRDAFFGGRFRKTAVYDGPQLLAGQRIAGPAIVEERFT